MTFPKAPNSDFDWERFDPSQYIASSYRDVLLPDDAIVEKLAGFFKTINAPQEVLEVGASPNLYPLLAALPVARRIVAIEPATPNVGYLRSQLVNPSVYWMTIWRKLCVFSDLYSNIADPFEQLSHRTEIRRGTILNLEPMSTDLASMHFVAESITNDEREFRSACRSFIRSVRPGGAFIASFMTRSMRSIGCEEVQARASETYIDDQELQSALSIDGIDICIYPITAPPVEKGGRGMSMVIGSVPQEGLVFEQHTGLWLTMKSVGRT